MVAARQLVAEFVADDPPAQHLAEELLTLLERTVRTSSAAETINSVLRPYLNRAARVYGLGEPPTVPERVRPVVQYALVRTRPAQRSKPLRDSGIDLGTDDWLSLLGFPPD